MRGRIAVGLGAALALAGGLSAQAPDLDAQRRRLADAKREAAAAAARADALARSAEREQGAAARAAADERVLVARVSAAAAEVEAARARITVIDNLLAAQRARLGRAQAPAARLLAALQSFARRPAVAAVAQPGSIDDLVHLRAVLDGALPMVERRAAAMRAEVARAEALQADAALAAKALRDGRARLEAERVGLARLEAGHRERARALGRGALSEADRALALGERARDIVDRMTTEQTAQVTAASLTELPGPMPRPLAPGARAEAGGGGAYRLPVAGQLVTGFDEVSPAGVRSRGLSFAVRPSAIAVAPAAGVVRYAKPYRGYGHVAVIDHGEGWSTTLIGLGALHVRPGARIAAGVPVGRAPGRDGSEVTVELRRRGRPIDIAALL